MNKQDIMNRESLLLEFVELAKPVMAGFTLTVEEQARLMIAVAQVEIIREDFSHQP